jgi:hypothetical protein
MTSQEIELLDKAYTDVCDVLKLEDFMRKSIGELRDELVKVPEREVISTEAIKIWLEEFAGSPLEDNEIVKRFEEFIS